MRFINFFIVIFFTFSFFMDLIEASNQCEANSRIEHHILKSTEIGDIHLTVVTPKNYVAELTAKFPILYQLDGGSFADIYPKLMDGMADADEIPRIIYVGIHTSDRFRDFTRKTKTENRPDVIGFLYAVKDLVIPFIEKKYRSVPFRIFSGHSLGGLAVFESLIAFPNLFNAIFAIDPSLWYWDENKFTINLASLKEVGDSFIYTALSGKAFGPPSGYESDFKWTQKIHKALPKTVKFSSHEDQSAGHISIAYSDFVKALRELFNDLLLSNHVVAKLQKPEDLLEHKKALSDRYHFKIEAKEFDFEHIASVNVRFGGDPKIGVLFAEYGIKHFPENPRFHLILGDALIKLGNKKEGKEEHAKACAIAKTVKIDWPDCSIQTEVELEIVR